MRILWVSNAPHAPTGYGTQTAEFTPRLKGLGHEMAITCFYGVQGAPMQQNGILLLPAGRDAYGLDVIAADAEWFNADIVLSLVDNWIFPVELTRMFNHVPWMPVDHEPVPPDVVKATAGAFLPICYSRFGQKAMEDAGLLPEYVPHAIDTEHKYYPVERSQARASLGIGDDRFLIGMVAANKGTPSRKAFDQNLRAFGRFQKRHPEAVFYLHTDWTGAMGENIRELVARNDIPQKSIAQPPVYQYNRGMIGLDYMRNVYSACDVVTNATKGEGFGLTIIEAQACGCPVIVGNYTAMPELVRDGMGWKVGYSDKVFSQNSYQFVPSVDEIEAAYEDAWKTRENADRRRLARDFVKEHYDAFTVVNQYWKPVLAKIEKKLARQTERLTPVTVKAKKEAARASA